MGHLINQLLAVLACAALSACGGHDDPADGSSRRKPTPQETLQRELSTLPEVPSNATDPTPLSSDALLQRARRFVVGIEQPAVTPAAEGMGVILTISEDGEGRHARILTSRYLVDPAHPVVGIPLNGSGLSQHRVQVRWPDVSTTTTGNLTWLSPCEDSNRALYRMDAAIITAPVPEGAVAIPAEIVTLSEGEGDARVVTFSDNDDLVLLGRDRVRQRPERIGGHRSHFLETLTYILRGGDAVPLGSPVLDPAGRLVGIVDAGDLISLRQRLDILRQILDKRDERVDAKLEELGEEVRAYYGKLSEKIGALNEPGGIAFLIKKVVHAISGQSDSSGVAITAPTMALSGAERVAVFFRRRHQRLAMEQLARAVRSPGAESLVRSAGHWHKVVTVVGILAAIGDFWRDGEVRSRFTEAENKRIQEIAQAQEALEEKLLQISLELAVLWSRLMERELEVTPCSVTMAARLRSDLMGSVYGDPVHQFAFSIPSAEWTLSLSEEALVHLSGKGVEGALHLHPESRRDVAWDLVGLGATWLVSRKLPANTFDATRSEPVKRWGHHAGVWRWSRDGTEHLTAIFERAGRGYVWEFGWPEKSELAGEEVLRFLEKFRFERRADIPKLDPQAEQCMLTLALKAFDSYDLSSALECYRYITVTNPDHLEGLNGLAWFLCINDQMSLGGVSIAHSYARKLKRLKPEATHIRDTLAWCHFLNGEVEEAVNIELGVFREEPFRHEYAWSLEQFQYVQQQVRRAGHPPSLEQLERVRKAAAELQMLRARYPVRVKSWKSTYAGVFDYALQQELIAANRTDKPVRAIIRVEVMDEKGRVVLEDDDTVSLGPREVRNVGWIQKHAEESNAKKYRYCRARVVKIE